MSSSTFQPSRHHGCRLLAGLVVWANGVSTAPAHAADVSFRNEVMAVLSKAGCNAGACHGNASGKAGCKLSLRGEDPQLDFKALTRDQFGRRVNLVDPDQSLILLKPTVQIAHEGGKRFARGSAEYQLLRDWIAAGTPDDLARAPKLVRLEVVPSEQILIEPANKVGLRVTATFSDGSRRDMSRMAVYEAANPVVSITPDGQAQRERFGESTVLVRYLDRQVPARLAFVPTRPDFTWKKVPANNYVDESVFAKLRSLRMNPSALCRDEVFIRRSCLDLLGILPTASEARRFVADRGANKRARLIDALLERPEFADFWALKWSDLLRLEERTLDQKGMHAFHHWIRESIAANKPMDQFARELISARGSTYVNPAANFYRANRDPVTRAVATAQVFLGVRLQCAQCHNRPYDRWTQADYYDWAAVFAKVQYKVLENRRQDNNDSHEFKGEQIVFVARHGELKNPRTTKPAQPRLLASTEPMDGGELLAKKDGPGTAIRGRRGGTVAPAEDELETLATWLTSPRNPFFARAQVNRIWYHLLGRGIADPIDDFRATNPPSHPELLEALAADFVRHQFDLRHLIRVIMNSRTYQLSSEPTPTNLEDEADFSHALVRRLTAEQLLDGYYQVAGVPTSFSGYPAGLRAAELPGTHSERRRGQKANNLDQFLQLFGKPPRLLTCECERSSEPTMNQAFQMISGSSVNELIANPDNRLTKLLASGESNRRMIEDLYWNALTRGPSPAELTKTEGYLGHARDRRGALEDIAWGLLNAKEFVLRE
jgi:hypothetical protein